MKRSAIYLGAGVMFAAWMFMISVPPAARGQSAAGGVHLMLGNPQGEFRQNVDNLGFGLAGYLLAGPKPGFAKIGGEVGFLVYGNESRKEPFSTTIPDVTVDVTTSNNILFGHLLVRLQVPVGPVQPYLDGLVGFNYLFTQTSIKNEQGEEEIATSTNFKDFTFSYGGAGGILIRFYQRNPQKPENPREAHPVRAAYIDFRIRYLIGGEANYLKEGSIRRENGKVAYDVQHSKTDIMTFQLGVTAAF